MNTYEVNEDFKIEKTSRGKDRQGQEQLEVTILGVFPAAALRRFTKATRQKGEPTTTSASKSVSFTDDGRVKLICRSLDQGVAAKAFRKLLSRGGWEHPLLSSTELKLLSDRWALAEARAAVQEQVAPSTQLVPAPRTIKEVQLPAERAEVAA